MMKWILTAAMLVGLCVALNAPPVSAGMEDNVWSVRRGEIRRLSDVSVSARGDVWVAGDNFATLNGEYLVAQDHSSVSLEIREIQLCGDGCGWAVSRDAFYKFSEDKWVMYQRESTEDGIFVSLEVKGVHAWAIRQDRSGGSTLFRLVDDRWVESAHVEHFLTSLSLESGGFGWAVGRSGSIYRLQDNQWGEHNSVGAADLTAVLTLSRDEAWAVGGKNGLLGDRSTYIIVRYLDGYWQEIDEAAGPALYALSVLGDTIVAGGEDGRGVFLGRGEMDWFRVPPPHRYREPGDGIGGIDCSDEWGCYLASNDGRVLQINRTGEVVRDSGFFEFYDIASRDQESVVGVGEFGLQAYESGRWSALGMQGTLLTSIELTRDGRVWVAGMDGVLGEYSEDTFRQIAGVPRLDFRAMVKDRAGGLHIVGTTRGELGTIRSQVVALQIENERVLVDIGEPILDYVHDIEIADSGRSLWAAGAKGLWLSSDGGDWEKKLSGEWYSVKDGTQGLWLAGRGEIVRYQDGRAYSQLLAGSVVVHDFVDDPRCGIFAVGEAGSVYLYSSQTWKIVAGTARPLDLFRQIPTRFRVAECVGEAPGELWVAGTEGTVISAVASQLRGGIQPTVAPETAVPFTPISRTSTPTPSRAAPTPRTGHATAIYIPRSDA